MRSTFIFFKASQDLSLIRTRVHSRTARITRIFIYGSVWLFAILLRPLYPAADVEFDETQTRLRDIIYIYTYILNTHVFVQHLKRSAEVQLHEFWVTLLKCVAATNERFVTEEINSAVSGRCAGKKKNKRKSGENKEILYIIIRGDDRRLSIARFVWIDHDSLSQFLEFYNFFQRL